MFARAIRFVRKFAKFIRMSLQNPDNPDCLRGIKIHIFILSLSRRVYVPRAQSSLSGFAR